MALSVAEHIKALRVESAQKEVLKSKFTKMEPQAKALLKIKLDGFYKRVAGYVNEGSMFNKEQGASEDSALYTFGDKDISLIFEDSSENDIYLIAKLNVSNGEEYFIHLLHDDHFYWEHDGNELTEDVFDNLMYEIIVQ